MIGSRPSRTVMRCTRKGNRQEHVLVYPQEKGVSFEAGAKCSRLGGSAWSTANSTSDLKLEGIGEGALVRYFVTLVGFD